ncbi:hypothetical protein DFJ74DRAFT_684857 [Hyaloraphidium curvatum]|nr:hypothetical protein DFJ74DRAFT_684857 [Hyaloraphidium curvatum]
MENEDAPELPAELIYRIAEFLPRRRQLEFARASRSSFELLAPLAFSAFKRTNFRSPPWALRIDLWERLRWFRHVRRFEAEVNEDCMGLVLRVLANASKLETAKLYFEGERDILETVLAALPRSIVALQVNDITNCPEQWEEEPMAFPNLRRLEFPSNVYDDKDNIVHRIVCNSSNLETVSLNLETGFLHGFDGFFFEEVAGKITTWTLRNQDHFVEFCSTSAFRPRKIAMDFGLDFQPDEDDYVIVDPETLASVARHFLPSYPWSFPWDPSRSRRAVCRRCSRTFTWTGSSWMPTPWPAVWRGSVRCSIRVLDSESA